MKFLEKNSDRHSLVGLCMGEQGIISRVLGVRAGSVFTFAAVSEDEKTAPGQVTAQELRSTYRIEQVDPATRVYAVAGDPVAHSLSPAIMNAALRRETVNGVYLALHAKTLKDLLGLRARNSHPRPLHHHALQGSHRLPSRQYRRRTPPRSAPATPWSAPRTASSTASTPMPPEWSRPLAAANFARGKPRFWSSAPAAQHAPPSTDSKSAAPKSTSSIALRPRAKTGALGPRPHCSSAPI